MPLRRLGSRPPRDTGRVARVLICAASAKSLISMTKHSMLRMIRDAADAEGGDISLRRFLAASGVKEKQIVGTHWATWNEAKREAGLETAVFVRPRIDEKAVIPVSADVLLQLGRWSTESELRLARKRDPNIPSVRTIRRLEKDREFLRKLRGHCESHPRLAAVASFVTAKSRQASDPNALPVSTIGHVYMMRSGRRYKIGHTSSPTRRYREVRLDLPERTDLVHTIETDDPKGIEAYWHQRFSSVRIRDTEFFELSPADIAAFSKRKFQ